MTYPSRKRTSKSELGYKFISLFEKMPGMYIAHGFLSYTTPWVARIGVHIVIQKEHQF